MKSTKKTPSNQYCIVIPGRGFSHTAEHAKQYQEKIRKIAKQKITKPFSDEVDVKLEYLYAKRDERLDGDNLLKTICDGLEGVAYENDSQIIHHEVTVINTNASSIIREIPHNEQIGDLFANQQSFTIIRIKKARKKRVKITLDEATI